jgi:hypothetical protein
MKRSLIFAAILALGFAACADTTDTNIGVTGTFVGTCSVTTGNTLALGVVDLSTKVVQVGTSYEHVRIPVTLGVTCNSPTLSWKLYNGGAGYITSVAIGTASNSGCLSATHTVTSSGTRPDCASSVASQHTGPISGTGTETVGAELVVWDQTVGSAYGTATVVPYRGSGAITATIPMVLEF